MVYTVAMTNKISFHALHGKLQTIIKLSEQLEKIPRKFGTDQPLSSSEVHLVEIIGEREGQSVTDIAKLHGVTKGAVSQTLKRLENKGFIMKDEDPANSSRSIVQLTNKGKTVFYAHRHWHETMDGGFKNYFESLPQDKIDFLFETLCKMEFFLKQRIKSEE